MTNSADRAEKALAPVVQYYGENPVTDFSPLSLKFVRDKMVEEGLARGTINTRIDGTSKARRQEGAAAVGLLGYVSCPQVGGPKRGVFIG